MTPKKRLSTKITAAGLAFLQAFFPVMSACAGIQNITALPDLGSNNAEITHSVNPDSVAHGLSEVGSTLNGNSHLGDAFSQLSLNMTESAVNSYLAQYGNASLSFDTEGTGEGKMLFPLFDSQENLLFTQLGASRNERFTSNSGLGYRRFSGPWMLGFNTFYDYDFTGHNKRYSLGAEVATDYFSLSYNQYLPLSDWHQAYDRQYQDFDERPARGYDLTARGYLPAYPALGGKLSYERYYGDNVILAGSNDMKKNPYSLSFGLDYSPVPLLNISATHKAGSVTDNQLALSLNYRFGVPLADQLNSNLLPLTRTLQGSRYNFVDRNNLITLQYRKQELIRVHLPESVSGKGGETMALDARVKSKYGLQKIEWSAPDFITHGGTIESKNQHSVYLHLPPYRAGEKSEYTLTALATDVHGNTGRASTLISVEKPSLEFAAMDVVKDLAIAGQEKNEVRIRLTDKEKSNIANKKVFFSSTQNAKVEPESVQTDHEGVAVVQVSSKTAGQFPVYAKLENGNSIQRSVIFVANKKQFALMLTAKQKHGIVANGVEEHVVSAVARDINGNVVPDISFELNADNGAVLKKNKITTDKNGVAEFRVTNTHAGKTTVKAKSENAEGQIELFFSGDPATAVVRNFYADPQHNNAAADGQSENRMIAEVRDANNNPVPEVTVDFFATEPLMARNHNAFTNTEGSSLLKLRSYKGGIYPVRACIKSACKESKTHFVSLSKRIDKISVTEGAMADSISKNKINVLVSDFNGHPLEGVQVYFESSENTMKLESNVEITNEKGEAQTWVTSSAALFGYIKVGVEKGVYGTQHEIHFQPNTNKAMIADVWVKKNQALADGKDKDTINVLVTDNSRNPIKGVTVSAEVTNGAQLDDAKKLTDDAGIATFMVSSTKVGSVSFSGYINEKEKKQLVDILQFNGDKSSSHVELKNQSVEVTANGVDKYDVEILVNDSSGIPILGATVLVESTELQQQKTVVTNKDGRAFASFNSKKAGDFNVIASFNKQTASTKIHFASDPSKYHLSQYKTSGPSVADGLQQNRISVAVLDLLEAPVNQYPVEFIVLTDGASVDNRTVLTNDKGIATVNLTSTTAGPVRIQAKISDTSFIFGESVFVADRSTRYFSYTKENHSVIANGKDEHIFTLRSKDKNNNIISGEEFAFENIDGLSITPLKGKTNDDGEINIRVTSKKSGLFDLKLNELTIPLTFIADDSDYFIHNVKVIKQKDIPANDQDAGVVEFLVTDKNGNALPNYRLEGHVSGVDGAHLVNEVIYSNTSGVATFSVKSTRIGTVDLNWAKSEKVSFEFIADKKTASIKKMEVIKDNSDYHDLDGNCISVKVADFFGNPVSDIEVEYNITSKKNMASLKNATKTNKNGVSTVNAVVNQQKYFSSGASIIAKVGNSRQETLVHFVSDTQFDYTATEDLEQHTLSIHGQFYSKKTGTPVNRPEDLTEIVIYFALSTGQNISGSTMIFANQEGNVSATFSERDITYKNYKAYQRKHPEAIIMTDVHIKMGSEGVPGIYRNITSS